MDADVATTETVLDGPVADQTGLHGLLDRIQSLGLELVEVRRLPPADHKTSPSPGSKLPGLAPGRPPWVRTASGVRAPRGTHRRAPLPPGPPTGGLEA